MAHIEYSNIAHDSCLVIPRDQAKLILPFLKRAAKHEEKLWMKYLSIHEGGWAAENDDDRMYQHEENTNVLRSLIDKIDDLCRQLR